MVNIMRRIISTDNAPKPVGPYSQAVIATDFLFISGQIGVDPSTSKLVPGGIVEETKRCLENVRAILKRANIGMEDVVKTTIFMTDMSYFKEVNEAYASYFSAEGPARSTIGVASLPMGAKIEIEVVAYRQRS
jgi:2-iminobutanoate/2-iminopropanoate deaminase